MIDQMVYWVAILCIAIVVCMVLDNFVFIKDKSISSVEFGTNPLRFMGISYVKRMYALRSDPRPILTVHMLFFVVWIKLPWSHVGGKGRGSAVCSYGFVFSLSPLYIHINKGYE